MSTLPINVVNLICEYAAQDDRLWYPFFCPKTGIIKWKINKYCVKYINYSKTILHQYCDDVCYHNNIRVTGEVVLSRLNNDGDEIERDIYSYNALIRYKFDDKYVMYIKIEKEDDIFNAVINFVDCYSTLDELVIHKPLELLYLNTTPYGCVYDSYYNTYSNRLRIVYSLY